MHAAPPAFDTHHPKHHPLHQIEKDEEEEELEGITTMMMSMVVVDVQSRETALHLLCKAYSSVKCLQVFLEVGHYILRSRVIVPFIGKI